MKLSFLVRTRAVVCAAVVGFSLLAGHVQASSGIFGIDIGLNSNKINTGTNTFFEADLLNDSRHAPINLGTVILNSTGFNGLNLGTFTLGTDSLTLVGGGVLTFKNSGSNVLGAQIEYKVDSNTFQGISLAFNQDNVSSNTGDQRWASVGYTVNLLNGLTYGPHTISFFAQAPVDNSGTIFDSNGGANYTASFTVVPEPATCLAGFLAIGSLTYAQRRRVGNLFARI